MMDTQTTQEQARQRLIEKRLGFKCRICGELAGIAGMDDAEELKAKHMAGHKASDLFFLEAL